MNERGGRQTEATDIFVIFTDFSLVLISEIIIVWMKSKNSIQKKNNIQDRKA